jgi:hypothetical protein
MRERTPRGRNLSTRHARRALGAHGSSARTQLDESDRATSSRLRHARTASFDRRARFQEEALNRADFG